MADNNFRYDRGRDFPAWDDSRQAASDPLAELARLIGQADPYAEADRRGKHDSGRPHDVAPAPDADWAAEDSHAAHDRRADERYAPPAAASHQPYAPQEPGYEDDEPSGGGRYFSGPTAAFNGFRDETDVYHGDEPSIALPARQSPALAAAEPYDSYESDQPELSRRAELRGRRLLRRDAHPAAAKRAARYHGRARIDRCRHRGSVRLSRDVRRFRPADASAHHQGR